MNRIQRRIVWLIVTAALIALLVFGFFKLVPKPPALEIDQARRELEKARDSQAEIYAKDLFREASRYFDSAMISWKKENERFILFRDYSNVIKLSDISAHKSEEAFLLSKTYSANLEKRTKHKLDALNVLLRDINATFSRFPLPKATRSEIANGKLLLAEGQVAFRNASFVEADKKFSTAETLLRNAHGKAQRLIGEYFENHSQWKSWMDETIAESKQKKSTVVLVDKFASKCYVYKSGKLTAEFDAELGKNWVGDKRHKGDHATPEGRYRITQKKEGRATKYYKALLIDYPNEDDKKRFRAEISNGNLPKNSKIGNLIEIHGHGGKGTDWTEGCVALTDSDMDKLYKMVSVGTQVTIIGSIERLEAILK